MGLLERLRRRLSVLISPDGAGLSRSGFLFQNDTLASNETIFSAITMLSGAMASLPITLRKNSVGVEAEDHRVAGLLEYGPNYNMTTFQFIRCMETLRDSTGAGYAIKELDVWGNIEALWLIKTEYVTPMRDRESRELYYHIRDPDTYEDIYMHNSFVLAVTHISYDGENPINPIAVLRSSLEYDKEVKEFSVDQMHNGLRAKIVVKWLNTNLSLEQIEEYNKVIQTFKKSGVLYLDKGKEMKELTGSSPIDPKVFESENITIARVARVYNIPLEKFLPDKTSYSSAEQSDLNYLRDTILPMVRMYEQEFSKKLLLRQERATGMRIKFSLNGFARADMKTRGEFYSQGIRSGWFCHDEVRELEDMPPLPDGLGQIFYISRDLVPARELVQNFKKNDGGGYLNG